MSHQHPAHVRLGAFHVPRVDADVADFGAREKHELTGVRRVGEDLLVTGQGGVENDLAKHGALGPERLAGPDRAVLQNEAAIRFLPRLAIFDRGDCLGLGV